MAPTKKKASPLKVFLAIFLGMLIGSLTQKGQTFFGIDLFPYAFPIYDLFGKLFINALTLVVVPLVSSSIITGIARIGNETAFKRLGAKTFSFYLGTSLLAILIGLFFVNLFHPGSSIQPDALLPTVSTADLQKQLSLEESFHFSDILLQVIPSNIVDTFAHGQMLGLIFFSLIFGFCISKIKEENSLTLIRFWEGIFQAMIRFTHILMRFLPVGVFFLVAKVFAEAGFKSLQSLGLFTLSVFLGLVTFMFIGLPLLVYLMTKASPVQLFRALGPALITAFSTSSSSATLPITIDCVEKRAGVSNRICSLVIPLGTSVNMSGSALYECVAAMFIAQAYGVDLSFSFQFLIALLALLTSIGVAGVPSASLVAIIAILKALHLPIEGIALFIAVDRILDMCRTTVNVFSDACCAILVAKSEGEKVLVPGRGSLE